MLSDDKDNTEKRMCMHNFQRQCLGYNNYTNGLGVPLFQSRHSYEVFFIGSLAFICFASHSATSPLMFIASPLSPGRIT